MKPTAFAVPLPAQQPLSRLATWTVAAEYFVDFWMGSGAWARNLNPQRPDRSVHCQRPGVGGRVVQ